jgi:hypothetical protein
LLALIEPLQSDTFVAGGKINRQLFYTDNIKAAVRPVRAVAAKVPALFFECATKFHCDIIKHFSS